jgi:hypothetical protein
MTSGPRPRASEHFSHQAWAALGYPNRRSIVEEVEQQLLVAARNSPFSLSINQAFLSFKTKASQFSKTTCFDIAKLIRAEGLNPVRAVRLNAL